tara:strand:- start:1104 stop:1691 length:588 start_codon:yes stop_codon:yes gene_type:complete
MSSQGFWTTVSNQADPKRKFRFLLTIGSMPDGATWYTKTVDKPEVTVKDTPHQFLNHTFYYPGSVTWNSVNVTLVDPVSPDASANLSRILFESGYVPPRNVNDVTTISKSKAVNALQSVVISQINAEGTPVETWTLNNAFITKVGYGGNLAYGSDELIDTTITFRYDWASLETFYKADDGPLRSGGSNRYWVPGT